MELVKFTLLFSILAFVNTCSHEASGTTTTTVTTSVTTVSADDDSRFGTLSSRERNIIRKTWAEARRDGEIAPQILFRFLKAHPDYQKKFSKFANVTQSDLMTNQNFLLQSYTILVGLDNIFNSIDSQERLEIELYIVGVNSYFPKVTVPMFEKFGVVVQEVLADKLGSSFDVEVKSAWKNGIRTVVDGIAKNLDMYLRVPSPLTKLIPDNVYAVQESWEVIKADRNNIISSIFIKLFQESPRAQKYFAKFSEVAVDDLTGNSEFKKQVGLIADRLDTIITNINAISQWLGNIDYMRFIHQAPRNIPRHRFEDFGRLLLDHLASKNVSSYHLNSWKGVMTIFLNGVSPKQ